MNNAIANHSLINDRKEMINDQTKSPHSSPENPFRHSPNGKNKTLLTKDIMSGNQQKITHPRSSKLHFSEAEHLVKKFTFFT